MLWRMAAVEIAPPPRSFWPVGLEPMNEICVMLLIGIVSFIYECCRSFTHKRLQLALQEKEATNKQLSLATENKAKCAFFALVIAKPELITPNSLFCADSWPTSATVRSQSPFAALDNLP